MKKSKKKEISMVDMFCGAGGTDEGAKQACNELGIKLNLIAVNHDPIAIATHKANHSDADQLCADLNTTDPRKAVPSGRADILVASPECIFHSNARGGKPINDQRRATAWRVIDWIEQLKIAEILIENVPEFRTWGPLIEKKVEKKLALPSPSIDFDKWYAKTRRHGGTVEEWKRIYRDLQRRMPSGEVKQSVKITVEVPDPKRKGEIYLSFLKAIESHGYIVDTRILGSADHGDPTTRERLFIRARLGKKRIGWPEPTHAPAEKLNANGNGHQTLFDMSSKRQPYRTAYEIIDWSLPSQSIFTRPRPLSPNTIARIVAGLWKFCGILMDPKTITAYDATTLRWSDPRNPFTKGEPVTLSPFLLKYFGGHDTQRIDAPLPAVTANYEHYGLCQPSIAKLRGGQPFIVELRGGQDARGIDEPLTTITTKGMHHAICRPFIVVLRRNADGQTLDEPLRTLTTGGNFALAQPFIVPVNHGHGDTRSHSLGEPLPTVTTVDAWGLINPFIINSGGRDISPRSTDEPLNTVVTRDHLGLVEPFIVAMEHGGKVLPINRPLNTITTAKGGGHGLAEAYLIQYNGTADTQPVDEPLNTVTSKDRFGLVTPELMESGGIMLLDVHFRMLQPHELAGAMGFPKTYVFLGNREKKVRQIGNAVTVNLAKALFSTILSEM